MVDVCDKWWMFHVKMTGLFIECNAGLNWIDLVFNSLMHNVSKWSDTLYKSAKSAKCCKIFKVCLTILRHYALKG